MVDAQHAAVVAGLADAGVTGERLVEMTVPGAFEVPMAARLMGLAQKVDAMVVIGLLIEGETGHYEYISKAVMAALMEVRGSVRGGGGEGGLRRGDVLEWRSGWACPSVLVLGKRRTEPWGVWSWRSRGFCWAWWFTDVPRPSHRCFSVSCVSCDLLNAPLPTTSHSLGLRSFNWFPPFLLSTASSRARRRSRRRSGRPAPSRRQGHGPRLRWRWRAFGLPRWASRRGPPTRSRRSAFSERGGEGRGWRMRWTRGRSFCIASMVVTVCLCAAPYL